MNKVRILAVAPYEGLREVLLSVAASREDIDMDVYVGDLLEGASIAKSFENAGYDIVLSRGGTATLIERTISLPVVDIAPSVYDILRFVRMAQNMPGQFAIVGFSNITGIADKVFDLIQREIEIYTIKDAQDAEAIVASLNERGCSLIVGDAIAVAIAKRLCMNSLLIASGEESVQAALNEAVRLSRTIDEAVRRNLVFRDILEKSSLSVVVFGADKTQLYSNLSQDQLEYQRVFRALPDYVEATLREGEFHIMRRSKGYLWEITGRRMKEALGSIAVFYIRRRLSIPHLKSGVVEFYHMLDANQDDAAFSPIDNIGRMASVMEEAERLGKTPHPVCIAGETGAPVKALIRTLYQANPLSAHPLVMIDCSLIDEKSFLWMLESEDSPLCEARITICLLHFSSLDEALKLRYIQFAGSTSLHKRNRLLYSVTAALKPNDAATDFFNSPECVLLRVPALAERPEDIPNLANLYLSALNIEMGRQVIGFSEEARALLLAYDWPGNNDQLRRIVMRCLIRSQADILTAEDVREGIEEERLLVRRYDKAGIDLSGTLEQISARIVNLVLKEEGLNRSKAAERLGISRSTLWRMLK